MMMMCVCVCVCTYTMYYIYIHIYGYHPPPPISGHLGARWPLIGGGGTNLLQHLPQVVAKRAGRRLLLVYASSRHSTDRLDAGGISALPQTVRAPLQPWFKYSTGLNLAQASTVLSLADTCSGKPVINGIFAHAYDKNLNPLIAPTSVM
jgi:hypothetical protein